MGGFPTTFFDAGYQELEGGTSTQSYYTSRMNSCGARAVPTSDLNFIVKMDWIGNVSGQGDDFSVTVGIGNGVPANTIPPDPTITDGETVGTPNVYYYWHASTTDAEGNDVEYQWVWDEGDTSQWYGPYPSGQDHVRTHRWQSPGTYEVKVRARDSWGEVTEYSAPWSIVIDCCTGKVGSIDDESDVPDGADLSTLIDHLFIDLTPLRCIKEADLDQSGGTNPQNVNIDGIDLSTLIDHLFISLDPLPDCIY